MLVGEFQVIDIQFYNEMFGINGKLASEDIGSRAT